MGTRNSLAEKSFNLETGILTWTFSDKTTQTFDVAGFVGEAWSFMSDAAKYATAHGVSQKGGDGYASAGTKAEDAGMTPLAWAKDQLRSILSTILGGDWSRAGAGGGGEPALIVAALAKVYGVTNDEAEAKVEAASKEALKSIKAMPAIVAAIATIKVERAAKALARAQEAAGAVTAPTAADVTPFDQLGA